MAWIETIEYSEADEALRRKMSEVRALFPQEYLEPVQAASAEDERIVDSHSLIPDALYHAFALLGVLLDEGLPLERRQHELIATVVSDANDCHY